MPNLTTKTKYVNIVVRKQKLLISSRDDLIKRWCNEQCELFAYIYHKKDVNLLGEIEDEHLHLVCTLKNPRRLSTTLTSFCDMVGIKSIGVEIDKINSYEGSLQYLIHKNDPQKTPHDFKEIVHNYDDEELKTIIESISDNLTAERLYDIVRHANCNYDIIKAIGLHRYHNLRNVIRDIKEDFKLKEYQKEKIIREGPVY